MRLFNTLTRQVEDFKPMVPGKVGLYSCGPTVYSYAHIGNMRSYVFADVLRRTLERAGFDVNHVMNITDVGHLTNDSDDGDDKLELSAKREGLDAWAVAKKYTVAFFDHAARLNILKPKVVCKATDHIPEQISMVQTLEEKGFAYRTGDGVYFDTSRFPTYTALARLDVAGLQEGLRVEMGDKRNKTDFALWKLSTPDEKRQMEWESPWGKGFPGWHIECSAMSMRFLGEQFDIHTGGVDHIPIHHTNEIAQSEAATGKAPFVRIWMHGEFLVIDDAEKMSKSLGNVLTVATLEEKGFDPLAFRALVLQSHYRKQLRFSYDNLVGAQKGLERTLATIQELKKDAKGADAPLGTKAKAYKQSFDESVFNDLNMPQAFATLHQVLGDAQLPAGERYALVQSFDQILGLRLTEERAAKGDAIPQEMLDLLDARNKARAEKRWADADKLRQEIGAKGWEILDAPTGTTLKRKL